MSNNKVSKRKTCAQCQRKLVESNFYQCKDSPLYHDGRFHICTRCCAEIFEDKENGYEAVLMALHAMNKPMLLDLWNRCEHPGDYFRQINSLPQYRGMTWEHGDLGSHASIDNNLNNSDEDHYYSEEVLNRWSGWGYDKIPRLEDYYQELVAVYEHKTPIQRSIYRNIAVAQMQADEAIANGNTGDYKRLMDVISDLMNDAKIKPLQETGMDDNGLNTWGEWVKKIEEEEPIPEPSEEFKDVDGIQKYIDKWFVGHMKKVLGLEDTTSVESDILEGGDE